MALIKDLIFGILCINILLNIYKPLHVLSIYFIFDFFIVNTSLKIHHFLSLFAIYTNYFILQDSSSKYEMFYLIVNTEISNIFYVLVPYIKHPTFKNINNSLFLLSFFKYRIYVFYLFLYNPHLIHLLSVSNNMYIIFFGFFGLNLFWFCILCKIACKPFFKNDVLKMKCQSITSYIYFINIPLSLYVYKTINLDVFGILLLAISSYFYHTNAKNQLVLYGKYTYEIMPYFYIDNLCIHIRSILACIDYFKKISCVYHYVSYIIILIFTPFSNVEKYACLTYIPVLADICFTIYNDNVSYILKMNMIFMMYLIGLVGYINPFYDINWVIFHILLIIQTYFICKTNIQTNQLTY